MSLIALTQFLKKPPERSDPAGNYFPVTKSDTQNFEQGQCKALNVGTAGSANVVRPNGSVAANYPLQQGYNPISCIRINTGGTADNIWALYDG